RAAAGTVLGGGVDFVVDVRDVCYKAGLIARMVKEPLEQREDHERPRVADMDWSIDRRAAHVHPDPPLLAGLDRRNASGARVVQRKSPRTGLLIPESYQDAPTLTPP